MAADGVEEQSNPILISDLPAPTTASRPRASLGNTPQQRVYFYESGEWEQFILEWATALKPAYVQVKRLGGAGDHGVDVAGFKSEQGLEGHWDCFQGKHYSKALGWSEAFPEMLKIFRAVVAGIYVFPDAYVFVAPKGCGPSLNRLLSRPSELKKEFLAALDVESKWPSPPSVAELAKVRRLAETVDFSAFRSAELHDVLNQHRTTPYYSARFSEALPQRPDSRQPPISLEAGEARYVQQLLRVYAELDDNPPATGEAASAHSDFGTHFNRQRVAFYSAESLRLYARDAVPPGTFEKLQDDIHDGVVELAEAVFPSGMDKVRAVLEKSTVVDLGGHPLIVVTRPVDRKGVCHQLANNDRLRWVKQS